MTACGASGLSSVVALGRRLTSPLQAYFWNGAKFVPAEFAFGKTCGDSVRLRMRGSTESGLMKVIETISRHDGEDIAFAAYSSGRQGPLVTSFVYPASEGLRLRVHCQTGDSDEVTIQSPRAGDYVLAPIAPPSSLTLETLDHWHDYIRITVEPLA